MTCAGNDVGAHLARGLGSGSEESSPRAGDLVPGNYVRRYPLAYVSPYDNLTTPPPPNPSRLARSREMSAAGGCPVRGPLTAIDQLTRDATSASPAGRRARWVWDCHSRPCTGRRRALVQAAGLDPVRVSRVFGRDVDRVGPVGVEGQVLGRQVAKSQLATPSGRSRETTISESPPESTTRPSCANCADGALKPCTWR